MPACKAELVNSMAWEACLSRLPLRIVASRSWPVAYHMSCEYITMLELRPTGNLVGLKWQVRKRPAACLCPPRAGSGFALLAARPAYSHHVCKFCTSGKTNATWQVRGGQLVTKEGLSYLEAKHLLLLHYCLHITFYLLLKVATLAACQSPLPLVERVPMMGM